MPGAPPPRPGSRQDEATSNLDASSDACIQRLLRREFHSTTLLTIAHRLATVIDYDTLLVLGRGKLLEQGPPAQLLERPNGALAAMVQALGGMERGADGCEWRGGGRRIIMGGRPAGARHVYATCCATCGASETRKASETRQASEKNMTRTAQGALVRCVDLSLSLSLQRALHAKNCGRVTSA